MRKRIALLFVLLLAPIALTAYNLDIAKIGVVGGEQHSSASYGLRTATDQGVIGIIGSSSYFTRLGWIYVVENNNPSVGQIQLCASGTCALSKTVDPATQLTIKVTVTDLDGQDDLNTESFDVQIYKSLDQNGCTENWDCNKLSIVDDNVWIGTWGGCTQTGSTYCINLPNTAWSTKFLNGDANIYVRIDDNSGAMDANFLTAGALIVNKIASRSEDATTGAYTGSADTNDAILTDTGRTGMTQYSQTQAEQA